MGRKARFSTFPLPAVRRDRDAEPVPDDLGSPPDRERASLIANIAVGAALAIIAAGMLVYAWQSWT
jgi:hypothetical protein